MRRQTDGMNSERLSPEIAAAHVRTVLVLAVVQIAAFALVFLTVKLA